MDMSHGVRGIASCRIPTVGLLCLAASVGLLTGCFSGGVSLMDAADLAARIRGAGVDRVVVPYELDDEMRSWVRSNVPRTGNDIERLELLAERLLSEPGLDITYRRELTGTARQVFETGFANCLSFTHLFVGMARELDIDVHFLEVRDLESYSREEDLVVHSDHIAVGFGPRHQLTIFDFAADRTVQYRQIRALNDLEATALYYSNRGAESLRAGDLEDSLGWLQDAVLISTQSSPAWVNFGVALRRTGELERAERAYRRALELNPTEYSAYQNLAALLRMTGRDQEAYDLLAVTDAAKNRNPYTFLALGDLSAQNGRLKEAERFYRRAVKVQRDDPEPLAAMGVLALRTGDAGEAQRWLRRARKIDPAGARVGELEILLAARGDDDPPREWNGP